MKRWTEEQDAALAQAIKDGLSAREAGLVVGKSESATQGRANRLKLSFESSENQGLRTYLREGGRLVREEIGGAVGIHWARATRSGGGFKAQFCERLVELGLLVREEGSQSVFRMSEAPLA